MDTGHTICVCVRKGSRASLWALFILPWGLVVYYPIYAPYAAICLRFQAWDDSFLDSLRSHPGNAAKALRQQSDPSPGQLGSEMRFVLCFAMSVLCQPLHVTICHHMFLNFNRFSTQASLNLSEHPVFSFASKHLQDEVGQLQSVHLRKRVHTF